jgi:glycosyltransferase involved in cell wall biosynthesis
VIDNLSNDETSLVIENARMKDSRIKSFQEKNQGLSFARNRGILEASSDWLLYLDDDAKLSTSNLDQILMTIDNYGFSLFTGVWQAWYLSAPPKWLPHSTGNYILRGKREIREIGEDYITGLIMVINKQKLQEIGGFPTHLGMTGDKVAYGEETYVEEEFKKRGWNVGINPFIVIDHLVGEHKYKLDWHLEAAEAKGRDLQQINKANSKMSAWLGLIKSVLFGWIKPLVKLIVRSEYYRQNFIIDYIGNIRFYKGILETFKNN